MAEDKITRSEAELWRKIGAYTPAEAAWLLIDKTPQTHLIDKTEGPAFTLACQIRDRFKTSDYGGFGTTLGVCRDEEITFDVRHEGRMLGTATVEGASRQRITLDELRQFSEERGFMPLILLDQESVGENAVQWPYSHDTKLLKAARWIIETYSNQEQWPTKGLVIEKLTDPTFQKAHGLGVIGKREAEAIDAVTRPDSIRGR